MPAAPHDSEGDERSRIEYKTIDITESEATLAWPLENDFRGPIVVVGETMTEGFDTWTGFRPDRIVGLASRGNGGTP